MPKKTSHSYNFEGGKLLKSIGTSFFVSYLYNQRLDPTHANWKPIATRASRISTINSSRLHHLDWLTRVQFMNEANLDKNSLGLSGREVKEMATLLLRGWD